MSTDTLGKKEDINLDVAIKTIKYLLVELRKVIAPISEVVKSADSAHPRESTVKSVSNKLNTIWFSETRQLLLEKVGTDKAKELKNLKMEEINSLGDLNQQLYKYGGFLEELRTDLKILKKEKYNSSNNNPIEDLTPGKSQEDKKANKKHKSAKLNFYPQDGIAEFKGESYKFSKGKKAYVLLEFMSESKNTSFAAESIISKCNNNIKIKKHEFKGIKDIADTIDDIRENLKVNEGELFPLQREQNRFIWKEK